MCFTAKSKSRVVFSCHTSVLHSLIPSWLETLTALFYLQSCCVGAEVLIAYLLLSSHSLGELFKSEVGGISQDKCRPLLGDKSARNKKISINLLSFVHNYLGLQETPSKSDTVAHHKMSCGITQQYFFPFCLSSVTRECSCDNG